MFCQAVSSGEPTKRLSELEEKTKALAKIHDIYSRDTRHQDEQVFDALRELMTPPDSLKRLIGPVNTGN